MLLLPLYLLVPVVALNLPKASIKNHQTRAATLSAAGNDVLHGRRDLLLTSKNIAMALIGTNVLVSPESVWASDSQIDLQKYEDFTVASEGWSYKDVKAGTGDSPLPGDRVVFDWSGYTIGYFGRPFQAKGGPQGGAFDKDLDYLRTEIGSGKMVPAVEQAFLSMKVGGVRQVVVPYGPLSYPTGDKGHELVGPKPATFSGMRALDFVLDNARVDRTMLFNLKLIRIDKKDPRTGAFVRGS